MIDKRLDKKLETLFESINFKKELLKDSRAQMEYYKRQVADLEESIDENRREIYSIVYDLINEE